MKCLASGKIQTRKIELSCWEANGAGVTASSTIYLTDINTNTCGQLTGVIEYTGFTATGNRLNKPHFEAEKKKYKKLVSFIGEQVLINPDNILINFGEDGMFGLYIQDEQEIFLPEEY